MIPGIFLGSLAAGAFFGAVFGGESRVRRLFIGTIFTVSGTLLGTLVANMA